MQDKIKVLLIVYYWPPSGGAGVQRWVKLIRYFKTQNLIPYVLAVDEKYASYLQKDYSLLKDIPDDIKIYKTKTFEPINIYAKITGKDNVPTAGFSNVDNSKPYQKIMNALRSNLFIPDPRKFWKYFAYKKATELIRKEGIKTVITSSPPHSVQLIGLKLKKNFNITWIADLRDPWTDIYYYKLLNHSFISKSIDAYYEKQVLINADKIITVSNHLKKIFSEKSAKINDKKIFIIPNGYDEEDFKNLSKKENKIFTITYTGTMAEIYKPNIFFTALKNISIQYPELKFKLQIIGKISDKIEKYIQSLNIDTEFIPTLPHSEIIKYQKNADLLLLTIPDIKNAHGILTGKLFEYLAAKNPIVCIGPKNGDAAKIIKQCNAGAIFQRDEINPLIEFLVSQIKSKGTNIFPNEKEIEKYSRQNQVKILKEIIKKPLPVSEKRLS